MIFDQERQVLTIEGPDDKEIFFDKAKAFIAMLTEEEYQALVEGEVQDTIALVDYQSLKDADGCFVGPVIYINENKLNLPWMTPELKAKIIQVLLRHEIAELWYIYEARVNHTSITRADRRASGLPHLQALLDEWRLAFELGCSEEYFQCIKQWAEEIAQSQGKKMAESFLLDNTRAYTWVAEEFCFER